MGIEMILTLVLTPIALFLLFLIEQSEPASRRCNMCQAFVGYDFCTLCDGMGECDHKETSLALILPVPISAVRCAKCRRKISGGRIVFTIGKRRRQAILARESLSHLRFQ